MKTENIPFEKIIIGENHRRLFSEVSIAELSESIENNGLIHPLVVRAHPAQPGFYMLVAGHRRFKAIELLCTRHQDDLTEYATVRCEVRELSDEEALDMQVAENLHRENITPLEEAETFQAMLSKKNMSYDEISAHIGKSVSYVRDRLSLNLLTKEAAASLANEVLPLTAAMKIAQLPSKDQTKVFQAVTQSITTLDDKKKQVFSGMESLRRQLDSQMPFDLSKADFSLVDETLNPTAGPCVKCPKRSSEMPGMFSDILSGEKCMDNPCYLIKAIAYYTEARKEMAIRLGIKDQDIKFMGRSSYSEEGRHYEKHLKGFVKDYSILTKAQESESKFKEHIVHAIFVGRPGQHDSEEKRTHGFVVPEKVYNRLAYGSSRGPKVSKAQKDIQRKAKELGKKMEHIKTMRIFDFPFKQSTESLIPIVMWMGSKYEEKFARVLWENEVYGFELGSFGLSSSQKKIIVDKNTDFDKIRFTFISNDEKIAKELDKMEFDELFQILMTTFALGNSELEAADMAGMGYSPDAGILKLMNIKEKDVEKQAKKEIADSQKGVLVSHVKPGPKDPKDPLYDNPEYWKNRDAGYKKDAYEKNQRLGKNMPKKKVVAGKLVRKVAAKKKK